MSKFKTITVYLTGGSEEGREKPDIVESQSNHFLNMNQERCLFSPHVVAL